MEQVSKCARVVRMLVNVLSFVCVCVCVCVCDCLDSGGLRRNVLNVKCVFLFCVELLPKHVAVRLTVEIKTRHRAGLQVKCPLFLSGFDENCEVETDSGKIFQVPDVVGKSFRALCCVQTVRHRRTCGVVKRVFCYDCLFRKCYKRFQGTQSAVTVALRRSRDAASSHCGPTPFKGRSQQSPWPYAVQGTQSAVTVALRRSRDAVSSHCGPTPFKGRSQQSLWSYAVQGTHSAVTVVLRRSRDAVSSNCGPTPFKGRSQQ